MDRKDNVKILETALRGFYGQKKSLSLKSFSDDDIEYLACFATYIVSSIETFREEIDKMEVKYEG